MPTTGVYICCGAGKQQRLPTKASHRSVVKARLRPRLPLPVDATVEAGADCGCASGHVFVQFRDDFARRRFAAGFSLWALTGGGIVEL